MSLLNSSDNNNGADNQENYRHENSKKCEGDVAAEKESDKTDGIDEETEKSHSSRVSSEAHEEKRQGRRGCRNHELTLKPLTLDTTKVMTHSAEQEVPLCRPEMAPCDHTPAAWDSADASPRCIQSKGSIRGTAGGEGIGGNGDGENDEAAEVCNIKAANITEHLLHDTFRIRMKKQTKMSVQIKVYNFLERPTGWKCFIYHFTV